MFSKDITGSDAFIDMPSSSQALYFHLGMEADDDGFIGNPKRIQKVVGTGDDDMRILISKRFVLVFPSGVVVIKHHRINNNWDKYNCKRTPYIDEFNQLFIKQNKAYTLDSTQGVSVQSENSLKTVFRIEENRIDRPSSVPLRVEKDTDSDRTPKKTSRAEFPHAEEIFDLFTPRDVSWTIDKTQRRHAEQLYARGIEKVKQALKFFYRHKDEEHCPQVFTPYLLNTKWLNLQAYANKL
jgi:hypothetical protein